MYYCTRMVPVFRDNVPGCVSAQPGHRIDGQEKLCEAELLMKSRFI
jgi:hypothetical protein